VGAKSGFFCWEPEEKGKGSYSNILQSLECRGNVAVGKGSNREGSAGRTRVLERIGGSFHMRGNVPTKNEDGAKSMATPEDGK